jgi:hypothetical protein
VQIFHPSLNTISKASLLCAVLLVVAVIFTGAAYDRSPYVTQVGVPLEQPIEFSHEHHAGDLGIDCRYCHASVETSKFAGMPATHTCMSCHSQIWSGSAMLSKVRESYASGTPIAWNRVHDLPDFAHFDHSIHISKGVGCSTCHGAVDRMPLMWKEHTLRMEWCLECHRSPERFIRPRDRIFDMSWTGGDAAGEDTVSLERDYSLRKDHLTNCSICHY